MELSDGGAGDSWRRPGHTGLDLWHSLGVLTVLRSRAVKATPQGVDHAHVLKECQVALVTDDPKVNVSSPKS